MNKTLSEALIVIMLLVNLSCKKDSSNGPMINEINEVLQYENPFSPTIYEIDLDLDGENDGIIELKLTTNVGGLSCSAELRTIQEEWSISSLNRSIFICQDTLHYWADSTLIYYKNYDCNSSEISIREDFIDIPQLYRDNDLESITILETQNIVLLHSYNGVGADGIYPDAVFNDITKSAFSQPNLEEWIIFIKGNDEYYGLKIGIESLDVDCSQVHVYESRRIE